MVDVLIGEIDLELPWTYRYLLHDAWEKTQDSPHVQYSLEPNFDRYAARLPICA